jgi:hypothetical protein
MTLSQSDASTIFVSFYFSKYENVWILLKMVLELQKSKSYNVASQKSRDFLLL